MKFGVLQTRVCLWQGRRWNMHAVLYAPAGGAVMQCFECFAFRNIAVNQPMLPTSILLHIQQGGKVRQIVG